MANVAETVVRVGPIDQLGGGELISVVCLARGGLMEPKHALKGGMEFGDQNACVGNQHCGPGASGEFGPTAHHKVVCWRFSAGGPKWQ